MWLAPAATRRVLLVLCAVFLGKVFTYTSDVQPTATLTNIAPIVVTSPLSNLFSTVSSKELSNTRLSEVKIASYSNKELSKSDDTLEKNKDVMVDSTVLSHAAESISGVSTVRKEFADPILSIDNNESSLVYRTESIKSEMMTASAIYVLPSAVESDHPKTSSIPISEMEKNESFTSIMADQKPSVSMVLGSLQPEEKTVNPTVPTLNREQSSIVQTLNSSTPLDKSEIIALTKQPFPISATSNGGLRRITKNSASTVLLTSESVTATKFVAKESVSAVFNRVNESFMRSQESVIHSNIISVKLNPQVNFTTPSLSYEGRETNKTIALNPSPSLTMKEHLTFTPSPTSVADVTSLPYSKSSDLRAYSTENDTVVKRTKSRGALFTTMMTQIEVHTVSLTKIGPTIPAIKQGNITVSNAVFKLVNKTFISTPRLDIYVSSSELQVYSKILTKTSNRIMPISNILMSAQPSKISNNQTKIAESFTTYRLIQPSSSPSSVYKEIINRTEKSLITDSIKVSKRLHLTYTKNTSVSMNLQTSNTAAKIKPTRTTFFGSSEKEYSTSVSNRPTLSKNGKEQRFSVKLKITSEEFRDEYVTSGEAFRQKSKEIEQIFNLAFKNMAQYLYTKVLRFFRGSLGCDVVIHTVSTDSEEVSAQEIRNIIENANNTGGFGKYAVGYIEVKEEEDREKDKKETWGRLPVIVVSILGGVCLVLLVLVISQCVSTLRPINRIY